MKRRREIEDLAKDVTDIVHTVAARRLYQVMEFVYEEYIRPLERENKRLRQELKERNRV